MIYDLCQLIINLTVVNADWKEVWYNAVKRHWSITYFTSVLIPLEERIRIPLKFTWRIRGVRWGSSKGAKF
jgi:tryptophan 2,3-dioxygenase